MTSFLLQAFQYYAIAVIILANAGYVSSIVLVHKINNYYRKKQGLFTLGLVRENGIELLLTLLFINFQSLLMPLYPIKSILSAFQLCRAYKVLKCLE